jgi:hypothetical protein
MPIYRRQIIRACKQRGWILQPVALEGLEGYLRESPSDGAAEDLKAVLDVAANKIKGGRTVTEEVWQKVVEELNGEEVDDSLKPENALSSSSSGLEIVSAFHTPCIVYDTMRKQFKVEEKRRSLFGSVEDKVRRIRK